MPILPTQAVLDVVNAPVTRTRHRCEIFEADGTTRFASGAFDARMTSGSVTIDFSRAERRAFEFQLANDDLALVNSPDGIWYDKIFRPYYSILIPDTGLWYDFPLGEFVVDSISEPHFPNVMDLSGRDCTKKCLLSKFTTTTTFAGGSSPEYLIRTVALNAGIEKFILPVTGLTVTGDTSFEKGVDRWTAMDQIATAYNFHLFFDAQGYLVMDENQDPLTSPLVHAFTTGPGGNLVSYTKSTNDSRIYNHVSVTGDSSDADVIPVHAEALNTEPSSPTRISEIGDRLYEYDSSFITTTEQAQAVTDSFLQVHALEEYNLDFGAIAAPWLEVGGIVTFADPVLATTVRMLLSSLTIPLGPGAMSGVGKRVLKVG